MPTVRKVPPPEPIASKVSPRYTMTDEDWRDPFLYQLPTAISFAAACAAVGVAPEIAQAEREADVEFASVWDLLVAERRKPLADQEQAQFLAALQRTGTEWAASRELGIRRRTLSIWQLQDPIFAIAREATLRSLRAGNAAILRSVDEQKQELLATRQMRAARGDRILARLNTYPEFSDSGFYEIVPEEGEDLRELAADLRAAAGRQGVFIQFKKSYSGRLVVRRLIMGNLE